MLLTNQVKFSTKNEFLKIQLIYLFIVEFCCTSEGEIFFHKRIKKKMKILGK